MWSTYTLNKLGEKSIKWVARPPDPKSQPWNMQHMKSQVCWTWLAPVGSAKDYPVFSKWVVYGEVWFLDLFISLLLIYFKKLEFFQILSWIYYIILFLFSFVGIFHYSQMLNVSCFKILYYFILFYLLSPFSRWMDSWPHFL